MSGENAVAGKNRRMAMRLGIVVVAMFGFGYALVPLYDVFCEITGLNGKTGVVSAQSLDGQVDSSRLVTVEFLSNVNSSLPWQVRPVDKKLRVQPGRVYETRFFAENLSPDVVVGQAVPSVSPNDASLYFNKTECFCFTRQRFEGGESREMVVRFVINTGLPASVSTVTLSYTFFPVESST